MTRAMSADLACREGFWYRWRDRPGSDPERKRRNPTWIPASRREDAAPAGVKRRGSGNGRLSCRHVVEASVRVA